MCGNASRCVGKYVFEKGLTRKTDLTLETLSGIKRLHLHTRAACGQEVVEQVTVDMGVPRLLHKSLTLEANGKRFTGTAVDMGNPHFVVFTDELASIDLAQDGRALEHHPAFPDRSNIEFVHVANRHEAEMHVWERGSGITQACGTGACASQVAAFHAGLTGREATVHMPGGDLTIRLDEATGHVLMTGGAETVFEGGDTTPTPLKGAFEGRNLRNTKLIDNIIKQPLDSKPPSGGWGVVQATSTYGFGQSPISCSCRTITSFPR